MTETIEFRCGKCSAELDTLSSQPCSACGATEPVAVLSVAETSRRATDSVSVSGTAQFNRTWPGQYHRMKRSFQKLWGVAPLTNAFVAAEIEDGFVSFFQNSWHLKDWLKNDPATSNLVMDVEAFINASPALKLTADVANGSKHLSLTSTRTGDKTTNMSSMQFGGDPTVGLSGSVQVASGGVVTDAVQLARDAMAAWDSYLASKGLTP